MANHGSYNPMQFSVEFETDFEADLREKRLTEEQLAALFHELVHVYQDMATAFCQRSMTIRNNLIASINNDFKGKKTISLPCSFNGDDKYWNELHELSLNFRQIPVPMTKECWLTYVKTKHPECVSPSNPAYDVAESVKVCVNGYEFQLDAKIIQECMAAVYEVMLFPASRSFYETNPYPYLIPVMLAQGVIPKISDSAVGLLCELALDYDYPGVMFVEFLEKVKDGQLTIVDIRKGLDTLDVITGGHLQTLQERRRQVHDGFLKSLENVSLPSCPKVFEDIRQRVEFVRTQRDSGKYLFDYIRNLKTGVAGKVYELLDSLSPTIVFNAGKPDEKYTYVKGRFSYSEFSVFYWMWLNKMYHYLTDSDMVISCPFYSYCHRMPNSAYDISKCQFLFSIPPEERLQKLNKCLFAAMLTPFSMKNANLEVKF